MATEITEKPLAQLRPSTTDATGIYSPATGVIGVIKVISICNVTEEEVTYRLFIDIKGSDYTKPTAIAYDHTLAANKTRLWECFFPLVPASNFAVRSGTALAVTFTVFGYEVK